MNLKNTRWTGWKIQIWFELSWIYFRSKSTAATMDGRRDGEPFSVHISSVMPVAATELLSFAMKLDYNDNRINGNVVDLFATPKTLTDNKEKYLQLLMAAFRGGLYQFQMNVVDSATLIAAKRILKNSLRWLCVSGVSALILKICRRNTKTY